MFVKKYKKSFCPLLRIPDIIPTVKVDVWEIFLWSKDKLLSTRGQLELHSCSVLIWCLKWWLESGGTGNNILQFHYMSQYANRILDKTAKYIKKPCARWKSMHTLPKISYSFQLNSERVLKPRLQYHKWVQLLT